MNTEPFCRHHTKSLFVVTSHLLSHVSQHLSAQGASRWMLFWQYCTEAFILYYLCYSVILLHMRNCEHGIHSDSADGTPALRSLGY